MRFSFLLLLVLSCTAASAGSFDYKAYSLQVNRAELAITNRNYKAAMIIYDSAFKSKPKPFVSDIYNASICAIDDRNNKAAMQYCSMLAEAGVGDKFFSKNSIYAPLKNETHWEKLLQRAAQVRDSFKKNRNELIHVLDSLSAKDQRVNHEWRAAGMTMDTKERKFMDLTYDTLSNHIKRIFDSIGFVSEQMIGASLSDDTTLDYQLPYDIIIIHNYQSRRQGDTLFRTDMYKAMRDGYISPEYLAHIEDFGADMIGRPDYGTAHFYIRYKCSVYLEKISKDRIPVINANRADIGLGSLDDDVKKILFKISQPENRFFLRANYSWYKSFANKYSEDQFLENSEVVVETITGCN